MSRMQEIVMLERRRMLRATLVGGAAGRRRQVSLTMPRLLAPGSDNAWHGPNRGQGRHACG